MSKNKIEAIKQTIEAFLNLFHIKNKKKKLHKAIRYASIPVAAIMAAYTSFMAIYSATNFLADNYIQFPVRIYFVSIFVAKPKVSIACGKHILALVPSAKDYLLAVGECVETTTVNHAIQMPTPKVTKPAPTIYKKQEPQQPLEQGNILTKNP